MDDKKKFEIEFEDDFDAWLAKHDEEKAKAAAPVPIPPRPHFNRYYTAKPPVCQAKQGAFVFIYRDFP